MDHVDPHQLKSFGRRRSLRLPVHDYREARPYHVTWGTHHRDKTLSDGDLARAVTQCVEAEAAQAHVDLYAYCVMPDHVHILLAPRDGANVVSFIQAVKSRTTRAYWVLGGNGRLWQRGFYDHVVRREESVTRIAEYILGNPVRSGLTEYPSAYPYSRSFFPPP